MVSSTLCVFEKFGFSYIILDNIKPESHIMIDLGQADVDRSTPLPTLYHCVVDITSIR